MLWVRRQVVARTAVCVQKKRLAVVGLIFQELERVSGPRLTILQPSTAALKLLTIVLAVVSALPVMKVFSVKSVLRVMARLEQRASSVIVLGTGAPSPEQ